MESEGNGSDDDPGTSLIKSEEPVALIPISEEPLNKVLVTSVQSQ